MIAASRRDRSSAWKWRLGRRRCDRLWLKGAVFSAPPAKGVGADDQRAARQEGEDLAEHTGPALAALALPHQFDLWQRRRLGCAALGREAVFDAADEVGDAQQSLRILAHAV